MLVEFLYHFFSFDLGWIVNFIFIPNNLLWLFMFAGAGYFFYSAGNGKGWVWATIFVTFYVWATNDFSRAMGWTIVYKNFLLLTMVAAIGVLAFFANDAWGKTRLPLINTLRSIIVIAAFNLFLM